MALNPFRMFSKSFIGVDIGTSSIKVVELSKKQGKTLTNYGMLGSEYFAGPLLSNRERGTLSIAETNISQALSNIIKEAGIKAKDAFFAIPDFATFFTTFDLPPMSVQEIPEAVKFEAPRRIPLPLAEVVLDWQIIKGGPSSEGKAPLRILLVAVPQEVIAQYQNVAASIGLKLVALEAEVFAEVRALIKYQDKNSVVCLVDIGERSTTINIVSQGILKFAYSFDVAGEHFTSVLATNLEIEPAKAEVIKRMYGITDKKPAIKELLLPLADSVLQKIKDIFDELYLEDKERVNKIILTGGGAMLPGAVDFLSKALDLPVEMANPFLDITFPPTLQETLQKLGPGFTIAVGMALRGLGNQ